MMLLAFAFLVGIFLASGQAETYSASKIYQFPSTTFTALENIAVRPNGNLVLTATSESTIYLLDPTQSSPAVESLYTFPVATSCLGITEISPDRFAIVVGSVNITTFRGVPGTFSIWSMDFGGASTPTVSKIAAIPQATILNGLTHLQANPRVVLAADSEAGVVYSLDVSSGAVNIAIQNSAFKPTGPSPLGINGLHVDAAGDALYFTNSALGTFGSIPIDERTGSATGVAKVVATDSSGGIFDDFALDRQGNAWITNHPNSIIMVTSGGQKTTIYNSSQLMQPTSAILSGDGQTLYVVADGDATGHTQSGAVWAIHLRPQKC